MTEKKNEHDNFPGIELRQMVLTTPVSEHGFTADADFPRVYGVLTDWNVGEATATIVSLRDGTASLYTTSTFGIIGGHGHERVREAALKYVKLADRYVGDCNKVTKFPYPKQGEIFYYLLTYNGVLLCVGNISGVNNGSDPTRPLFAAAQDVLTELRTITQNQDSQSDTD